PTVVSWYSFWKQTEDANLFSISSSCQRGYSQNSGFGKVNLDLEGPPIFLGVFPKAFPVEPQVRGNRILGKILLFVLFIQTEKSSKSKTAFLKSDILKKICPYKIKTLQTPIGGS
ncbi:MAG: hypothetical protein LBG22_02355, partial [Treponema sp.]|nr:hypothetical protein [Treponema sp.]